MGVRRVQITGDSSYMVTLPKEWIAKVGIGKNSAVRIQPQPDGSLLIVPDTVPSDGSSVSAIDLDSCDDSDFLFRQLVGAYVSGIDSIELVSRGGISREASATVSDFVHTAIGMEITEDDGSKMLVEDFMDHRDIRPIKSVDRMRVLARKMMSDVIGCFESGSADGISDMDIRDSEIDRLDWLISRQISILQNDITLCRKMGADLPEVSGCGNISRCIERIGDHTVLVASAVRDMSGEELSSLNGAVRT